MGRVGIAMRIRRIGFTFVFSALTLLAIPCPLSGHSSPEQGSATVKVKGVITDDVGAVLPNASVIFKLKKYKKSVVARKDGSYEIDLPPGVYQVRVKMQGCHDFKMKEFDARSQGPLTLNVSLKCPPTPII